VLARDGHRGCGLGTPGVAPDGVGLHTLFAAEGPLDPRLSGHLAGAAVVLSFLGDTAGPVHRRLSEAVAGRVFSIDPRPTRETLAQRRHITWAWAEALRTQGVAVEAEAPEIRLAGGGLGRLTGKEQGRVTLIHLGSGGAAKCWPIEWFMELADRMGRDAEVRWMLGPAELERDGERLAPLRRRLERSGEMLIAEEDLTRAAERVVDADAYVGNDAGMTHVAAALGVPTVVIFTATDPAVWRPLNANARVVSAESWGGSDVSVEAVWRAVSNE
jgi:heptosyltransferase-3